MVSWVRCGTCLYRFLIVAAFLTLSDNQNQEIILLHIKYCFMFNFSVTVEDKFDPTQVEIEVFISSDSGVTTFFMLNLTEHELSTAHKIQMLK